MKNKVWYRAQVIHGAKIGRKIGYPTVNLSLDHLSLEIKRGVYGALVKYNEKIYKGVLFFGPKLFKDETHDSLEIHILDFDQAIYGEIIEFEILDYIRGVGNFKNEEELKKQIGEDITKVQNPKSQMIFLSFGLDLSFELWISDLSFICFYSSNC